MRLTLVLALLLGCTPAPLKITEPDWDTDPVVEVDTDTDTDSDTDTDTDADTDSDTDTDTDTDTDPPDPERIDNDGDGYCEHAVACDDGALPGDCDDDPVTGPGVNPGATELCNGIDDNCLDGIDEPGAFDGIDYYIDDDGDGYGVDGTQVAYCADPGAGFATEGGDCDDDPITGPEVHPLRAEDCSNGIDDNCNGVTDEDVDVDSDGVSSCSDCDDSNPDAFPGNPEVCGDGFDNDCNGLGDEELYSTFYEDFDGDTFGNPSVSGGYCDDVDAGADGYVADSTDCDDLDPYVNPDAQELCDGADTDEDCDSLADNDDPDSAGRTDFYEDDDGDGYGNDASTASLCDSTPTYSVSVGGDCDDTEFSVNPAAYEQSLAECGDGHDNECDGNTDGVDSECLTFYDQDGDGYCEDATGCADGSTVGDCDESDIGINPGASEVCDASDVDENCNGSADNADATVTDQTTWCIDGDIDTYGDCSSGSVDNCDPVPGYVDDDQDCNDGDATINPDGEEVCGDTDDEDCSGSYDDRDDDGDSYVDDTCTVDGSTAGTDCDDTRDFINPGATEDRYTAWNEDCDTDGLTDNGVTHTLAFTGSFAFTGANLIANVEDDSTFETGTVSGNWTYRRSDEGYVDGDLGITDQAWTDTLAGDYPSFEVLPPTTPGGTTSECVTLDNAAFSSGFTVGGDYGVKFIVVNPDSTNNNGVQVYTETDYAASNGPFESRSISTETEEEYVGYFSPTTSTESLVFCWGNWQGSHGWITHVVVGEGTYTP